MKTVALDAMGGDHGPKVIIPAAIRALRKYPDLKIILVGKEPVLARYIKKLKAQRMERLIIHHATEEVEMHESPAVALRTKKDSSMRVAINLVHEGKADACVSAGNTGALMATARFVLKTLAGIDRPAILASFPSVTKLTHMLDLGANIDSSAEHLFQFAVMGSVLVSLVCGIDRPTVALLNVGTEDIKGSEQVKETAQRLSECSALNYTGYVEGSDIFKGTVDLIVCDGFVGNIALKASEGLAKFLRQTLIDSFKKNIFTKFCCLMASPVLHSFKRLISPERYNGASFLGLNGLVIKSHGGARTLGFYHAIEEAVLEIEKDVLGKISENIASILEKASHEVQ
jgi:glycerol-3-phosphate acyltransferase PlsX